MIRAVVDDLKLDTFALQELGDRDDLGLPLRRPVDVQAQEGQTFAGRHLKRVQPFFQIRQSEFCYRNYRLRFADLNLRKLAPNLLDFFGDVRNECVHRAVAGIGTAEKMSEIERLVHVEVNNVGAQRLEALCDRQALKSGGIALDMEAAAIRGYAIAAARQSEHV